MLPELLHLVFALALGFAFAGLLCSGYQLATESPLSFKLLERGPRPATFAAVLCLVFAAPFIIMRASIKGLLVERRGISFVVFTIVFSGFWSLMSGTVTLMAVEACLRL
jgi:hypothetical protein